MMDTANGRADIVSAPLQLGDFLPERKKIVLNGRTYEAWVTTNRRYPRRIQAQLDRYNARYKSVADVLTLKPEDEDYDESEWRESLERHDEVYQTFVTDALMALVPNLSEDEAELIPLEMAEYVLRELGYFSSRAQPEPAENKKERRKKNDDVSPLTGGTSPEDSASSTRDTQTTSS